MASDFTIGVGTVLSSALGAFAQGRAIRDNNRNILMETEAAGRAYISQVDIINDQKAEIERELSDVMTLNSIEALKNEATVRAINASRGVVGSSVDAASINTKMEENLANAKVISDANDAQKSLLRRELTARIDFDNKMSALRSGIQGRGNTFGSVLLAGLTGGLNTFTAMGGWKSVLSSSSVNGSVPSTIGVTEPQASNVSNNRGTGIYTTNYLSLLGR